MTDLPEQDPGSTFLGPPKLAWPLWGRAEELSPQGKLGITCILHHSPLLPFTVKQWALRFEHLCLYSWGGARAISQPCQDSLYG